MRTTPLCVLAMSCVASFLQSVSLGMPTSRNGRLLLSTVLFRHGQVGAYAWITSYRQHQYQQQQQQQRSMISSLFTSTPTPTTPTSTTATPLRHFHVTGLQMTATESSDITNGPNQPAATTETDAPTTTPPAFKRPAKFIPFPFEYHEEIDVEIETLTNRGMGIARVPIQFTQEQRDAHKKKKGGRRPRGGGGDSKKSEERSSLIAAPNDSSVDSSSASTEADDDRTTVQTTNWVVMVPGVIPGERVRLRIFRNFNNYSEADLVQVLQSSPDRIEPKCSLYGTCGGCQLQHMSIGAQRDWKQRFVQDGLKQYGITDVHVSPCLGTDEVFGYRSKLTPHYQNPSKSRRGRKNVDTKDNDDDDDHSFATDVPVITAIGFQKSSVRQIVDVPRCPIGTPEVNVAYERARESLLNSPPPGKKKKGATLLFRQGNLNDEYIESDNNEYLTTTVGSLDFRYRAGNFFQNNYYVLPLMVEQVLKYATAPVVSTQDADDAATAEGTSLTHLADCYCGSGLFALSASQHFDTVVGIEINNQAIEEATQNAQRNNVTNCEFRAASAEAIFDVLSDDFPNDRTAIVLDPPRKGCSEDFLKQLYDFAPQRIIYMSCDPTTQARDSEGIVKAGYAITKILPFDLFPQTRHIECLMIFEKESIAKE